MTYRLLAFDRTGVDRVSALPEPMGWDVTVGHSTLDVSLTVTYHRDAAAGTVVGSAITDGLQYAVQAWNPTTKVWVEPDGARFKATGRDLDLVEVLGADGSVESVPVVRVQCSPVAWESSKIQSLNVAALLTEGDNEGKRPFLSANPGLIVGTFLAEYEARHPGASWPRAFTTGVDSAGAAWAHVLTIFYDHQTRLDVALENLVNQGAVEFTTRGSALVLVNPPSGSGLVKTGHLAPDRTATVALTLGSMVSQAPSEEWVTDLANHYSFHGGDGLNVTQTFPEVPLVGSYGPWEASYSSGSVTDAGTALAFLQATAAANGRLRGQYVQDLVPVLPDDAPVPLVDYAPGAWVLAHGAAGLEPMRLQQVVIRDDGDGQTVSLVLNDVLLEDDLRRAKRQLGIVGGSTSEGGSNVRPAPEGPDKRTPAAPGGLVVSSDPYTGLNGDPLAQISAQWGAVSTANAASGGGLLEVSGYELWGRLNVTGAQWRRFTVAQGTSVDLSPLPPSTAYQWRVRAVGRYATSPGDWSNTVTMTTAEYVTPPPVPSVPVLSTRLGVITAAWDGLTETGTPMPVHFRRVEVAMSTASTVNPPSSSVIGSLTSKGGLPVTGQPYGQERFFRFRSVGTGGTSAWSPERSIATEALVDAAWIQGEIDGAQIEDGTLVASDKIVGNSIIGSLIAGSTVKAEHLDANEIWADNAFLGHARAGVLAVGAVNPKALSFGTDELAPNPMWQDADLRALYPANTAGGWNYSTLNLRNGQTHTLRVVGAVATNNSRTIISPDYTATPGEKVFLEITALNTSSVDYAVGIQARVTRSDGAVDVFNVNIPASSMVNSYETRTGVVTMPAGAVSFRLALVAIGTPTTGVWYVSQVSARRALSSTTETGEGFEITPRSIKAWRTDGEPWLNLANGEEAVIVSRTLRTGLSGEGPSVVIRNDQLPNLDHPSIWFTRTGAVSADEAGVFGRLAAWAGTNVLTLQSSTNASGVREFVRTQRGHEIWAGPGANETAFRVGDQTTTTPRWNFAITSGGNLDMSIGSGLQRVVSIPFNGITFDIPGAAGALQIHTLSGEGYVRSSLIRARTTSAAANVHINASGNMFQSTSLRAGKVDITTAPLDLDALRRLRPVTFRDKGAVDRGEHAPTLLGLIAEEVADTALPGLATYGADDTDLVGVAYERLAVALLPWLHEHDRRLTELEERHA